MGVPAFHMRAGTFTDWLSGTKDGFIIDIVHKVFLITLVTECEL